MTTPDWFNIQTFGADPTGTSDSTAAIQDTLNAIITADGGVMYISAGDYLCSGVTYNSTSPLRIIGDAPGVSNILCNNSSNDVIYLNIINPATFRADNFSFTQKVAAPAAADVNVALAVNNVNWGKIDNVTVQEGAGNIKLNQGFVLTNCNYIDIDNCLVYAVVNGLAFAGSCQVNNIRSTTTWLASGSGVSTAAGILVQGDTLTLHANQVVMHDGDRGVLWTEDSSGNIPHVFIGYDLETNNPKINGMEFDYGAQVL